MSSLLVRKHIKLPRITISVRYCYIICQITSIPFLHRRLAWHFTSEFVLVCGMLWSSKIQNDPLSNLSLCFEEYSNYEVVTVHHEVAMLSGHVTACFGEYMLTKEFVAPAAKRSFCRWNSRQLTGPIRWLAISSWNLTTCRASPSSVSILMNCACDPVAAMGICLWTASAVMGLRWASRVRKLLDIRRSQARMSPAMLPDTISWRPP